MPVPLPRQGSAHLRKLDSTLAGVRATAARSTTSSAKSPPSSGSSARTERAAVARMDAFTRELTMMPI